MPSFARVYSDEQRAAVQQAAERKVGTDSTVVALARAGELTFDGELVPAFNLTHASAGDIRRRYLKQREKQERKLLAEQSPRDSVERLRQRATVAIGEQLEYVERQQAKGSHSKVSGEDLRQILRAIRELAALPGPQGEPAQGRQPGARAPGEKQAPDGRTRGGLGASILATTKPRRSATAQHDAPESTDARINTGERAAAPEPTERATEPPIEGAGEDESVTPGDYARAQAAQILA